MPVWKIQLVHQAGLHNFVDKYQSKQEPFQLERSFLKYLKQNHGDIFPLLLCPGNPSSCASMWASWTAGEVRRGKWSPASLSKVCLLRCHCTALLDTSASAATAFFFSLDGDWSQGIPYWKHWESDFTRKKLRGGGSLKVLNSPRAGRLWAVPLHGSQLQPLFLVALWSRKKKKILGTAVRFRSCRFARCAKSFRFWLI